MSTESLELISLCEEILEDGEITVEKIRRLGTWLEEHEEDRLRWPGDALIAPLREALLDDKITKTELRKLAALLRRTQKEWVKRRAAAIQQAITDKCAEAAARMNLSIPAVPIVAINLEVASHSTPGVVYAVDLGGPSCSCPDWKGARAHLPSGSFGRCCKHIIEGFTRVHPPNGWPGWFGTFVDLGWTSAPSRKWFVLDAGSYSPILAAVGGGNQWCDVYAFTGGAYQRFGYSLDQKRWSYGEEPPGKRRIEGELRERTMFVVESIRIIEESDDDSPKRTSRLGAIIRRLFGIGA